MADRIWAIIFIFCTYSFLSVSERPQDPKLVPSQPGKPPEKQATTLASPPLNDEVYVLFQIDRDIRKFSFQDVDELLFYEDDTLLYALTERLAKGGQNNTGNNVQVHD